MVCTQWCTLSRQADLTFRSVSINFHPKLERFTGRSKCLAHESLSFSLKFWISKQNGSKFSSTCWQKVHVLSLKFFVFLFPSDPGNPDLSADASGAATSNIPLTDDDRLSLAYDPDEESEWLGEGRETMSQRLVTGLEALSQLNFAGPFVYPVDVQQYPDYWSVVPYPTDLNTIREKLLNKYYRWVLKCCFQFFWDQNITFPANSIYSPTAGDEERQTYQLYYQRYFDTTPYSLN